MTITHYPHVPTIGKHQLMITDLEGENTTCQFEVIGK